MKHYRKWAAGISALAMLISAGTVTPVRASAKAHITQPVMVVAQDAQEDYKVHIGWFGDLDLDDSLSVTDIVILQKYLVVETQLTDQRQWKYADLDGSGRADIIDLTILKQCVLTGNWIEDCEYIKPTEDPTDAPTEPPTEAPTEEIPYYEDDYITAPLSNLMGSLPSQGDAGIVVFYVDFPDCRFDYEPSVEDLTKYCFGDTDPSDSNYPCDSMAAFYETSSKGSMHLQGKVFRYTTKENKSAYDTDKEKLMNECYAAFDAETDYSAFDMDKDGMVDATLFSVPTKANNSNDDWWPCAGPSSSTLGKGPNVEWYDPGYQVQYDGTNIGYIITGNAQVESAADYKNFVGSYLHEMGHCMGLPDYYLYYSSDSEGFHGSTETGGVEMMDMDASADFCAFSKLMLGWYKTGQVSVYDQSAGGAQTFRLSNAQQDDGNCLILPYGDLDSEYLSEYIILEYVTPDRNNSNIYYSYSSAGNGIRAFHIKADKIVDGYWGGSFKYENGAEATNEDDDGIRLIRMVGDEDALALKTEAWWGGTEWKPGGGIYHTGDVLDKSVSGFAWYDANENESVDTGYSVVIGECADGACTVTVTKN